MIQSNPKDMYNIDIVKCDDPLSHLCFFSITFAKTIERFSFLFGIFQQCNAYNFIIIQSILVYKKKTHMHHREVYQAPTNFLMSSIKAHELEA